MVFNLILSIFMGSILSILEVVGVMRRKIICIDEEKCDGCKACIPNCPEGALQVIDGKARLVSDLYCDGLGACIGHCPKGALTIEERPAAPYDERAAMENIVKHGKNTVKAHLQHLEDHGEKKYYAQAVSFLREKNFDVREYGVEEKNALPCGRAENRLQEIKPAPEAGPRAERSSALRQWPVQLALLSPQAPFFENADLLVASDCVPFANPHFHDQLLRGRTLAIGCPKLDDVSQYRQKLTQIISENEVKSITVAIMELPCCYGMQRAVEAAVKAAGKNIAITTKIIGVNGAMQ
ncbi:MAG: 4Fe-4S binding protein [Candidatus Micrarchaeota archaeon]